MSSKMHIHGTIRRQCPECRKYADCNCFEHEGKHRMLCSDCTFKEFRIDKPKKNKKSFADYELCPTCKGMTMRYYKDKTRVTKTHVLKYLECDKCGRTMKKTIKLRRQYK